MPIRPANDISRVKFLAACQNGHLERIKNLVQEHKIVDWWVHRHKTTGDTALHLASRHGHLEMVRYLCDEQRKLVNVVNFDMKRPLHEAAQFAHGPVVSYLLAEGAEVDALKRADWTPLMLACTQSGPGAVECVDALLKYGAEPSLRNKDGWTALLLASRAGEPRMLKLLIERSPGSVGDKSNNGRNALHVAAFHAHRETMNLLLEAMPELLEARDSSGCTPLLESVKSLDFGVTRCLIERGADVEVLDNIGQGVLHVAALVGNLEVVQFVLDKFGKEIKMTKDRYGITPLQIAEKNQRIEVAELLR